MASKQNIYDAVYETGAVATKKNAKVVVDTVFNTIIETTKSEGSIQIVGFGTFRKAQLGARKGKAPNGTEYKIAARRIPKFKAGKAFKEAVKNSRTKKK